MAGAQTCVAAFRNKAWESLAEQRHGVLLLLLAATVSLWSHTATLITCYADHMLLCCRHGCMQPVHRHLRQGFEASSDCQVAATSLRSNAAAVTCSQKMRAATEPLHDLCLPLGPRPSAATLQRQHMTVKCKEMQHGCKREVERTQTKKENRRQHTHTAKNTMQRMQDK